ncbi:MAG: hypothetical protein ACPG4Q_07250 [Phycisphaeraceae bacterium]
MEDGRCPECGTAFSPGDQKTYRLKAKIASPVRPVVSLFAALLCLILFFLNDPFAIRDGNHLMLVVNALPYYLLTPMLIVYCCAVRGTWMVVRILAVCTLVIFLMSPQTWKYSEALLSVLQSGIQS